MAAFDDTAARRGGEVRCPACARFKAPRGPCPICGCGEIAAARHGAARMLLAAGVDRFSLAERVAVLEPRLAEVLERQYAEQWALAQLLLEDVRRCATFLLQEGFVEDTEDLLAERLPTAPSLLARDARSPERAETLEALFAKSAPWEVKRLAGLALLHQGKVSWNIQFTVYSCLLDEGRVGVEAMLAVTRWRVWQWIRLDADGWKRVRELARKALGRPELSARAAVACLRAARGQEPEMDVLFALRQGLSHPDPEVRFECALCLQDEAGLLAALDSPQVELVSEARRALSSLGSSRLFARLAREGDSAFALDVVKTLPRLVPSEALEALLSASERGPDRLTEALLHLVEGQPFAEWSAEARVRWGTWARSVLRELPGEAVLRFLQWAGHPPVAPESVRFFVEATAEVLAREPSEVRARLLGDAYISRFLALAGPDEEPLLNRWAREAECGLPLAQALMTLTSRLQDWQEPEGQAARLLVAVWEGPGRQSLLEPFRKAVREWSGIVGRDELIDAVWGRFQRHPDERADLLSVFEPWRQELWERQLASPEDAVARFKAWWRVDPAGFARQADLLMREAPAQELPRRVSSVFSAAEEVVGSQPWIASLGVFYAAAALANAFRAGEDSLAPDAERFLEWFPGFELRVLTTPAEDDHRAPLRPFLEELHTEARLMRQRLDAAREAEKRKRQQELKQREAESRRQELERQPRDAEREAEEARRVAEGMRRATKAQRAVAEAVRATQQTQDGAEAESLLRRLRPRTDGKPIDHEPIFPGKPLPTLVDYVRLLKGMGLGDPLKAMASAGLDVSTWTVMATAWGQAMVGRMELGMRFGELMAAPWE